MECGPGGFAPPPSIRCPKTHSQLGGESTNRPAGAPGLPECVRACWAAPPPPRWRPALLLAEAPVATPLRRWVCAGPPTA
eukprot:COSAG01_NODE_1661_length_9583_cov_37.367356_9_plen_80_part_00